MKQSRKDLIFKLYNKVSSEMGKELKKEFPELFKVKPLEVGKWYKGQGHSGGYFMGIYESDGEVRNGFWKGNWSNNSNGIVTDKECISITPATDKEVEIALIKEFEKKNKPFDNYTYHFKDNFGLDGNLKGNFYGWNNKEDDPILLLSKSEWATIIKTITKEQAEKELGKTILN